MVKKASCILCQGKGWINQVHPVIGIKRCPYCFPEPAENGKAKSKYNAVTTEVDGYRFDSRREAARYSQLKLLLNVGMIRDLELQPSWTFSINGVKVCTYRADFGYLDVATGLAVVEDAKGVRTPVYRLKKRLMKACYGIEIREV